MGNLFFDEPGIKHHSFSKGDRVRVLPILPCNGITASKLCGAIGTITNTGMPMTEFPIEVVFDRETEHCKSYTFKPEELELIAPPQETTHGQQARLPDIPF